MKYLENILAIRIHHSYQKKLLKTNQIKNIEIVNQSFYSTK